MTFKLNSEEYESSLGNLGERVLDKGCTYGESEAWEVGPVGITEWYMKGMGESSSSRYRQ